MIVEAQKTKKLSHSKPKMPFSFFFRWFTARAHMKRQTMNGLYAINILLPKVHL